MQITKLSFWRKAWPGLTAALALAILAAPIGDRIPWLGGAGLGILSGVVIASLFKMPAVLKPGLGAAGKQVLQAAVILLGAGLNLAVIWRTGLETLGLMLVTISAVFLAAWFGGRLLGVKGNNRDLIASGTAICGGSAIAAVAPVIGAKDEEISYSISVVFLFNLAAVLIFPALGHLLNLSPQTFGVWAGTAVNDTSSVLATSFAFNAESVPTATLVKMTRTVMIVPMALIFSFVAARRAEKAGGGGFSLVKVFPWFVLGFLLMSVWATWGGLSAGAASGCKAAGKFLIVVALSGIGLNTDLRKILATGIKPMILGAFLWFVVAALALVMIGNM
ncbi:putative sulfate exporter family transporter [Deltaproteobacteria bacterium OttesenSCG-928-K17]|nr:putative sulfate exporter family transporter [Deltaproteobacteria bacterium OttesenSCG-928-K17]